MSNKALKRHLNKKNSDIFAQGIILKRRLVINKTKYLEGPLEEAYAQDMAQALEVAVDKGIIINDVFVFIVATNIVNDHDPQTIDECRLRHD